MFTYGLMRLPSAAILATLGAIAFTACIVAEFKKNNRRDVKLDGPLCHVPMSSAMWLGILSLICFSVAQFIGNIIVFRHLLLGFKGKGTFTGHINRFFIAAVIILSWIIFIIVGVMVGAAASMNADQPYGKEWLNGECYVVKDNIFLGSAFLIFITLFIIITLIIVATKRKCESHSTS